MKIWKSIKSDELIRHSAILFSGMIVVHISNILFQMAIGRALPKDEYVLVAAFLGVLAMIQRPLGTLRSGLSYYSSILRQEDREGDIKRLLRKWLLLTGGPSLLLGMLVLIFNSSLAHFFHLERVAPVVVMGAVLPALFAIPVLGGSVQGLQLFRWSSAANISGALTRLGLGAGFVWFLYPACGWAMLGHGLGIYMASGVLVLGLIIALRGTQTSNLPLPSMRFYLLQSFLIQAAYVVLMTADVVLIKHYVPQDTEFAYAATLSRMVVFLPGAIVAAMFPKVASRNSINEHQLKVFFRSFGYTALFVLVSVLGCCIFASLLARILFGIREVSSYLEQMIRIMSLIMGTTALSNVILQFLVAQHRFLSAFAIVPFAVLYLAAAMFFHGNSWQLVAVFGGCNAGALIVGLAVMFRLKFKT